MDRRSFLNQVGISSLTVASAAVGINNAAEAGNTFVSEASKSVTPKEGPLRLSDDLTKMITDPSLLQKPDNLVVACYTFPNYHPSAIHNKLYGPG